MSVERGGLFGSGDGELQHRLSVPGGLRVVGQLRQVSLRLGRLTQRREDPGVEEPAAQGRDGAQDGFAGQVMAEGQAIVGSPQQATGDALVGFVEDGSGDAQQEVRLDGRANNGRHIQDRAGLRREARRAGEDGVPHGSRYVRFRGG